MYRHTIETGYNPIEPFTRALYLLELLERRLLMTMVPIDATAGVPFNGLVATELHLPSYATSPQLMNVLINGQWDYTPTAVKNSDGTYDLYTKMTPQRAGTEEAQIIFRNNNTGGWDLLESGMETVKDNDFQCRLSELLHLQFSARHAIPRRGGDVQDDFADAIAGSICGGCRLVRQDEDRPAGSAERWQCSGLCE